MAIDVTDIKQVSIESISPQLLRPHPRNIEIYGRENVDELKRQILASCWIKPLVVTRNNMIISGHRRWQAACELKLQVVPVERRPLANEIEELEALLLENASREKTPEQGVREGDVWKEIEEAKSKARQIALAGTRHADLVENFPQGPAIERGKTRDKVAERVGFGSGRTYQKADKVVKTADKLSAEGNNEEAKKLLDTLNKKSVDKAYKEVRKREKQEKKEKQQEDVKQIEQAAPPPVPALVKELEIKPGQTWRLGNHLLYCGDSSSAEFISLANEHKSAFAFADPPYNAGVAEWDKDFVWKHDYLLDLAPIVAVTPGISAIKDFMCVTNMAYKWSMSYFIDNGTTRGALGFGNWMYVALFSKGSIHRNSQDIARLSITNKDRDELEHKGRKPLDMMHHIISLFSKDGEVVIDPFLGTGSSLIVCEQTGRRCIGAEINPDSCKYIIKWWENKSGKKAEVL